MSNVEASQDLTFFGHSITLAGAMGIVTLVAMSVVAVSYVMYLNSPASKYDLARPGQSVAEPLITARDDDVDTTSKVDISAAKHNLRSLQKNILTLQNAGEFSEYELSNQNLGLELSTQPSL